MPDRSEGPDAGTLLAMETRRANASLTCVQRRDPEASHHKGLFDSWSALRPAMSRSRRFDGVRIADRGVRSPLDGVG